MVGTENAKANCLFFFSIRGGNMRTKHHFRTQLAILPMDLFTAFFPVLENLFSAESASAAIRRWGLGDLGSHHQRASKMRAHHTWLIHARRGGHIPRKKHFLWISALWMSSPDFCLLSTLPTSLEGPCTFPLFPPAWCFIPAPSKWKQSPPAIHHGTKTHDSASQRCKHRALLHWHWVEI